MLIIFLLFEIPFNYASGFSTPDVASFTTETGQNVNLYTGSFSLGIPVMEIPARSFSYPLNLGYKSGIQFSQEASWVGLGWDLNPGAISRSPRDIPDDWRNILVRQDVDQDSWSFGMNLFALSVGWSSSYPQGRASTGISGGNSGMGIGFSYSSTSGAGEDAYYTYYGLNHIDSAPPMFFKFVNNYLCMPGGTVEPNNLVDVTPDLYIASSSLGLSGSFAPHRPNTQMGCNQNCIYGGSTSDCKCLNNANCYGSSTYYFEKSPINLRKIDYSEGPDGRIKYFIITDTDGTRYVYSHPVYTQFYKQRSRDRDTGYQSSEIKYHDSNIIGQPYAYAWLLTAVLAPNFVDRTPYVNYGDYLPSSTNRNIAGIDSNDEGDYVILNYNIYQTRYNFKEPQGTFGQYTYTDSPDNYLESYENNRLSEGYIQGEKELTELTQINTPTHIAEFISSNRLDDKSWELGQNRYPKKLEEIRLKSKADPNPSNYINKVVFAYDYSLHQNSPNSDSTISNGGVKGRLTLKQVQTFGENSQVSLPPYKFTYAFNPNQNSDPELSKYQFDPWGFYNPNAVDNHHLYGTQPWAFSYQFNSHAWSLTKIDYPTGGSLEVAYEPNQYVKIGTNDIYTQSIGFTDCYPLATDQQAFAGYGIRTKWVKLNDGIGNDHYMRYYYYNGDFDTDSSYPRISSGVLSAENIGFYGKKFVDTNREICWPTLQQNGFGGDTQDYVGYSKVTEVPAWDLNNPTNNPFGRIVHEFKTANSLPTKNSALYGLTDYGTYSGNLPWVSRNMGDDRDYARGVETSIKYYNSALSLIKQVTRDYQVVQDKSYSYTLFTPHNVYNYPSVWHRWAYTRPISETTTLDSVQSTVNYQYNDLGQIKQVSETNGDGKVRIKKTTYAHERPEYSQMLKWNILTPVYSEEIYENSIANGNLRKVSQQTYKRFNLRTDPQ